MTTTPKSTDLQFTTAPSLAGDYGEWAALTREGLANYPDKGVLVGIQWQTSCWDGHTMVEVIANGRESLVDLLRRELACQMANQDTLTSAKIRGTITNNTYEVRRETLRRKVLICQLAIARHDAGVADMGCGGIW